MNKEIKLKVAKLMIGCFAVVLFTMFLSGCSTNLFPGGPSPAGVIVTNVTSPAQNLTVAIDKDAKSLKMGSSSASAVGGLFAFGDSSVDSAMKSGGISKVHHIDHKINSIFFGLWLQNTTIVHGE